MKQTFILLLVYFYAISYAQDNPIENANKLIEQKKYESAYEILDSVDPTNNNPEIVIAKTDLLLNYFVTSIMHQLFALKDLEVDEDIMDIRGSSGSYSMFSFYPDSILYRLILQYPDNYKLYKTLGYYYHEVHLKYQGNWLEPDSILIQRLIDNYKIAYDNGVYDYWSTYGIGYGYLVKQEYKKSIPYFHRSTELNPSYPSSYYNMAYAYLYNDEREKAIENAKIAMDLYEYPQYKADAARMIAVVYIELNKYNEAWDYYSIANTIEPDNYYTLKPLLELEVNLEKDSYLNKTKEFFLLAPGNPTIYQDLIQIYWSNNKIEILIEFFENLHKDYLDDFKVNGNLYFYIAVIQYDMEDFINSKKNFEKSREFFKQVFEPDHSVFEAIDSYTNQM